MTEFVDIVEDRIGSPALGQIIEAIADMMWSGDSSNSIDEGEDGAVWLSGAQSINAFNRVAAGAFWWGGVEYSFEAEADKWDGFKFRYLIDNAPIPEIAGRGPRRNCTDRINKTTEGRTER